MLDLVFLKYITVDELEKVLREFIGENTPKFITYPPANLLFILDNRRNIHRIEDLIRQFDSDMFTNQRVRLFQLENAQVLPMCRRIWTTFSKPSRSITRPAPCISSRWTASIC